MSDHVRLPRELRLAREDRHVQGYLELHDPALRIRRSVERPTIYILERRCRRRPTANLGMRDESDMHIQARDGYIHVASVHPSYLNKPWNIIRALKEDGADTWERGGAAIADEEHYEMEWARETRRRRRLSHYRDIAKDAYDVLSRHGNNDGTERTRISNPGVIARSGA